MIILKDYEKQFIHYCKDLIEAGNWDEFFGWCSLSSDIKRMYQFIMFDAKIDLLHKMSFIPSFAFHSCEYNIGDLVIPSNIKEIKENAFENCNTLTSIDLSKTKIKIIPYSCFEGCKNLNKVTLPETCETIVMYAFTNCPCLKEVYVSKKSPNLKYIQEYFKGDFRDSFSNVKVILI